MLSRSHSKKKKAQHLGAEKGQINHETGTTLEELSPLYSLFFMSLQSTCNF